MFKKHFLYISLLLTIATLTPAQTVFAQKSAIDFTELEKVVRAELKETNTPGAAVAVVSNDRVVFSKGFGVASIETNAPVTPDMLFRIGSTTKPFTAAAVLMLVEEGKINLDAGVGDYVEGLAPRLSRITVRQLLSHTAGIKDVDPDYGPHDEAALGATIRTWKDEDFFFTEPGRIFSYSNEGYDLLGLLIQEVAGKSYAQSLRERLLVPLGMNKSVFRPVMAMTYPFAQGHTDDADEKAGEKKQLKVVRPFPDNVVGWPNGFLFSSANELARFAVALLNDGKIEGKQAISPSVIKVLRTPRVDIPAVGDKQRGEHHRYGYGMQFFDYRGIPLAIHNGGLTGFGCVFMTAPEQRFAIIILANKSGQALGKSARKAMEMMLPLKAASETKQFSAVAMTEAEMKTYAGTYWNNDKLNAQLSIKEGKLFISFKEGDETENAPVQKTGEHTFIIVAPGEPPGPAFVLIPGTDGKTEYLHFGNRAFKKVR